MSEPTCAFGEPWLGEHPLCATETERLCAEFDAAVARGELDEDGCRTEHERQAHRARLQRLGRLF